MRMNVGGYRIWLCSLLLAPGATSCAGDESVPSTTTDSSSPSITVTDPPPTPERSTTTSTGAPAAEAGRSTTESLSESQQATSFIWEFDPLGDDPNHLGEALDITGVHIGLGLPVLIEEGSEAVRVIVFAKLAEPSPWSVPILVEMAEFGMPSGSRDSPKPWPVPTLEAIERTLAVSAQASYEACAELMIDLEGIDLKTAQTRLGHTDPRLTLGIYAQATAEADRHAADRLGDRFPPRTDQDRGRDLA